MDDVAAGADVSRALVYEYFASKEELTIAAAAAWVEGIEEGVAELLDAGTSVADLQAIWPTVQVFDDDPFFGFTYRVDGAGWNVTIVDEDGNVGLKARMVLDLQNRPVAAYYDATNTALKLAWSLEMVPWGK